MDTCKKVIVRPMKETDVEILLRNYVEQGWSKSREVLEDYLSRQNDNTLFMFMAEIDDDVAGFVVLYEDTTVGPFANEKIPLISDFIVFKKFQRQGIGNKILDAAEEKAATLSDKIQLGVGVHGGYGAAQRIYVKRDYIPDGSGVWYRDSRLGEGEDCKNDDDLIMYFIKEL